MNLASVITALLVLLQPATQAVTRPAVEELVIRTGIVLRPPARFGRTPLPIDPVQALRAAGGLKTPSAGDVVAWPDGRSATWESISANNKDEFVGESLAGAYLFATVNSPDERVMLLDASGHGLVYVNDEPRAGDPYILGYVRLPVLFRRGENTLLFQIARGRLSAKFTGPTAPALLDVRDATLPDVIANDDAATVGAVVVVNASTAPLRQATLSVKSADGLVIETAVPSIPPLSTRKVRFNTRQSPISVDSGDRPAECRQRIRLISESVSVPAHGSSADQPALDEAEVVLRVRRSNESRRVTFVSEIDGSVQYYAVLPAKPVGGELLPAALVLSLHGADVEAINQVDSYAAKSWAHIVAPTNRRRYGFDWEDWGRLDALEVLSLATRDLKPDPQRVYLTGHSMGGHGTWQLAAHCPDRFAAIAPSAGWISFQSYAGAPAIAKPTPVEEILQRAAGPSDTLAHLGNYSALGIYILHGDADDNVPVTQAREMRAKLTEAGYAFGYHEQPGAGHWWDDDPGPGAACVDWPPIFELFSRRIIPVADAATHVDFTTTNPGVSASCHWLTIRAQITQHAPSRAVVRWHPEMRLFRGTTENVSRLDLDTAHAGDPAPLKLALDDQVLPDVPASSAGSRVSLDRVGGTWRIGGLRSASEKQPSRYGLFKDVFRNRFQCVYGTGGDAAENSWAFAKARFDAETFWYRGNGSVDLLSDRDFDPAAEPNRNVVLYGNADTNSAWAALLGNSPVQIRRGKATVGDEVFRGDDLGCLLIWPRPGSNNASVAAVAGTGSEGMRTIERFPYFLSGVAYPDCLLIDSRALSAGARGIRAAGFFGLDWTIERGEFAFGE